MTQSISASFSEAHETAGHATRNVGKFWYLKVQGIVDEEKGKIYIIYITHLQEDWGIGLQGLTHAYPTSPQVQETNPAPPHAIVKKIPRPISALWF